MAVLPAVASLLKCLEQPRLGRSGDVGTQFKFPGGAAGTSYLGHELLPPRVLFHSKQGVGAGLAC